MQGYEGMLTLIAVTNAHGYGGMSQAQLTTVPYVSVKKMESRGHGHRMFIVEACRFWDRRGAQFSVGKMN